MQYKVIAVADDDLPDGTDWALVREGDEFFFFVKDGRLCPPLLNQAWQAFVQMEHSRHVA